MTDKDPKYTDASVLEYKSVKTRLLQPDTEPPSLDDLKKINFDPKEFRKRKAQTSPSKNFWMNTALGRTLTGRNKTGRVVRRVGIGALGVAGSIFGIDTSFLEPAQTGGDLLAILKTIEMIAWIISGTILAVTKGVDQIEIQGERYDEQEILEGKVPGMRKLKRKTKR